MLVLDNANIHHRAPFQARLQHWEDLDGPLFYLPTYSPHLNKIETRWRKINYEWLRPEAYLNFCSTLLFFNYLIYSCLQLFSSRKVPLLPV